MTTTTRQAGLVTIVDIRGQIVLGEECVSLGKLVSDLLDKGHNKILVNLADVHRVDTAGLAYIVSGLTSARKRNGPETPQPHERPTGGAGNYKIANGLRY